MNVIGELFSLFFINPTVNVLSAIYHLLLFVHMPAALGFSIILLTILIRLLLYPFTASQLRTAKKMQELAPKLNKLKDMHKNDAKKLQEETTRLYKEHGVNPLAGCLPMVIQLPLIWGLYNVLQNAVSANAAHVVAFVNHVAYTPSLRLTHAWDPFFFGLPLAQAPAHLFSSTPLILLVPVATAVFQFIQTKMMMPGVEAEEEIREKVEKKKEDDFQAAFQSQSLYIFPLMIGFFSFTLPVGLSFYWNTFTIFGIIQQYQIQGLGGVSHWIKKAKKK